MVFKYSACCLKKKPKYQNFIACQKILQRRLDLKEYMLNQARLGSLKSMFMEPYQLKLISEIEKK